MRTEPSILFFFKWMPSVSIKRYREKKKKRLMWLQASKQEGKQANKQTNNTPKTRQTPPQKQCKQSL